MSHLDRIAALLVKAERSDNPHEAEAYLAKAQALATQASVDLAVARALTARREAREQPVSATITIGERGKRANTHLVSLFVVVGQCNSLQVDIAHNSTYVIAYGMPSDIELVEALFGSLATQMTASATTWLAVGGAATPAGSAGVLAARRVPDVRLRTVRAPRAPRASERRAPVSPRDRRSPSQRSLDLDVSPLLVCHVEGESG